MSSRTSDSKEFASDDGGAVLAETAITLPMILLLIFGIIEIGFFLWQWNAANKATQLGVRYAVTSNPIVSGPGITTSPIHGRPLGTSCRRDSATNPCYTFWVECNLTAANAGTCIGSEAASAYSFQPAAAQAIIDRMQGVFPGLDPSTVRIRYSSNGLGFVGHPGHVQNDVTVTIQGLDYPFAALAGFVAMNPLRLRASATQTSEDLRT